MRWRRLSLNLSGIRVRISIIRVIKVPLSMEVQIRVIVIWSGSKGQNLITRVRILIFLSFLLIIGGFLIC